MDATRTAGSVLHAATAHSHLHSLVRLAALTALLCGMLPPAHAQPVVGSASAEEKITGGSEGFRYRNEVTVDAAHLWQEYWQLPLFRPDRQLIERRDWSGGIGYTHTFEDRLYDRDHYMEVSQRLLPVSRVHVGLRRVRAMAAEPEETWLMFGAAGKVTPSFALGGSIGLGQGERTVYFDGGDSLSGEKSFTWLFTATADIRISRRVTLRESVSMGSFSHELDNGPDITAGSVHGFAHELLWQVTPSVSYSHVLAYRQWKEYRSTTLFGNDLAVAVTPAVILKGGLRMENLKSERLFGDLCLGVRCALRIQPTPYAFVEGGYDGIGGGDIFTARSQVALFVAAGARF